MNEQSPADRRKILGLGGAAVVTGFASGIGGRFGLSRGIAKPGDEEVARILGSPKSLTRRALDDLYGLPGIVVHRGDLNLRSVYATLDDAERRGEGTIAFFPPGAYDLEAGVRLGGYSVQMRGAGAHSGTSGTVFHASRQKGPCIDWADWRGPETHFTGRVTHGGFTVRGSGHPDRTIRNAGMRFTFMQSSLFHDIAIMDTGGPCILMDKSHRQAFYLSDMERVTLNTPVGAFENDVPYWISHGANGNRFRSIGLRSSLRENDVGSSGAVVVLGDQVYSGGYNHYDSWWFENLHAPSGAPLFSHGGDRSTISNLQFFDCKKNLGATDTSYLRLLNGADTAFGGNIVAGLIPGGGQSPTAIDMGIDVRQSRNLIQGVKGVNGHNVVLAKDVTETSINLGGSFSKANRPAVVDRSENLTNSYDDARNGLTRLPVREFRSMRPGPIGAAIYDQVLRKPLWSDGEVWRDAAGREVL